MAVFDLETTGVDTANDEVVTACAGLVDAGQTPAAVTTASWLANPGRDIPPGATAVHGITTEHAREHGRPVAEVLAEVSAQLAEYIAAGHPIVGMNLAYDLTLLDRRCRHHRVPTPEDRTGARYDRVIDVYVLDKKLYPRRPGKRKLVDLCTHYGVPIDGAHDATFDALAAARVAWRQALRFPRQIQIDPRQLHQLQVTWRASQCVSLQQYFARIGKTEPDGRPVTVDPCWPVCRGH